MRSRSVRQLERLAISCQREDPLDVSRNPIHDVLVVGRPAHRNLHRFRLNEQFFSTRAIGALHVEAALAVAHGAIYNPRSIGRPHRHDVFDLWGTVSSDTLSRSGAGLEEPHVAAAVTVLVHLIVTVDNNCLLY